MSWVLVPVALLCLSCLLVVGMGFAVLAVERGVPIRLSRARVSTIAREWAGHCVFFLLIPFGLWPAEPQITRDLPPRGPDDAPRNPVVLVPGYAMNRSNFFFFASYLRRRGWAWVHAVNHRPHSGGLRRFAEGLARQVEQVRRVSGAEQVDIVAHSMGGVVAALYIRELGGATRVRRLITLGTPWQGSRIAVFGFRKEAAEMLPNSALFATLDSMPVPVFAVYSDTDHMLIPPSTATPAFAKAELISGVGHVEMLASTRVFRLVRRLLDEPIAAQEPA